MKKIIYFIMLIVCMFSVSAVSLVTDQDQNVNDYYNAENGNIMIQSVAGSYSTTNNQSFGVGGLNGTYYYYDLDYEFVSTSEDFYLMIQNADSNKTGSIYFRGDLNKDGTLYIQNFTFNDVGRYYFKFEPSYEAEPVRVYLEFEDSFVGTIEYAEEKPKGFTGLVGGLVDGFSDVIEINISLWRIAYYTIVTAILVGFTLGVFAIAFWIFRYAKRLREGDN